MHSKVLPDFCYPGTSFRSPPKGVVIHYFSAANVDPANMFDMDACRRLFIDLNRPRSEREWYMQDPSWREQRFYASAHLLIGRDGTEWKLVDFHKKAYHAGKSIMNAKQACNQWTVGIELVGTGTSGFTEAQYVSCSRAVEELMHENDFTFDWVQGHDTVRHNANVAGLTIIKKTDPSGKSDGTGDNFDWARLKQLVDLRQSSRQSDSGLRHPKLWKPSPR